ncbi:hypothetical protein [uncultured Oscillibacter sp.]|uniref:hypothetical protein n=1 Tax=uncultured Oscillibacter sp. TaxID=876091 RepID=UPI002608A2D9|nr:hypothetical protein [uncultured Oscillibacter sp.]
MRRFYRLGSLFLVLLLLTACGAPPEEPEEPPEEVFALPELGPAGSVSARAIRTTGSAINITHPTSTNSIQREYVPPSPIAELPEADAAFYAVDSPDSQEPRAWLEWGDSLVKYDGSFAAPQPVSPRLWCFDVDSDGKDELILVFFTGTGTGVSIEELHVVKRFPDHSCIDYALPQSLWQEEVPKLFDTAEINGRTFAILGHELTEFDGEGLDLDTVSSGLIAGFSIEEWGGLRFRGAFCLSPPDSAVPRYVAYTSAEVLYRNGVFTLHDFHLYSYDQ